MDFEVGDRVRPTEEGYLTPGEKGTVVDMFEGQKPVVEWDNPDDATGVSADQWVTAPEIIEKIEEEDDEMKFEVGDQWETTVRSNGSETVAVRFEDNEDNVEIVAFMELERFGDFVKQVNETWELVSGL